MEDCDIKVKYTPNMFGTVSLLLKQRDWQSILKNRFIDANELISAIKAGEFNSGYGTPSLKSVFLTRDSLTNAKEVENLKAEYISNNVGKHGGDYNKMRKNFLSKIVESCLLDKDYKRIETDRLLDDDVSILNHNIYDLKVGFIKELRQRLFRDEQIEYNDLSDVDFTKLILSTVNEYESRRFADDSLDDLWDTYFMLKNFNQLLSDFDSFVQLKPEYQNTGVQGLDMYVAIKPFVAYDTSFNPDEFASADQYASEVLKTLLDFFKEGVYEVDNKKVVAGLDPITFKGYNFAVTRLCEWVERQKNESLKRELDKGNNVNWITIINAYLKSDEYNKEVAKKLLGLKLILGESGLDSTIREMLNEQRERVVRYQFESYRLMFDPGLNRNVIVPMRVEDGVTEAQKRSIAKTIRVKVNRFRKNPKELDVFLKEHGITVKKNEFVFDNLLMSGGKVSVTVVPNQEKTYAFNLVNYSAADISNDAVKELVEDLFDYRFPDDYESVFNYEGFNGYNMWYTFRDMIMRTLAASLTGEVNYPSYTFRNNGIELEFKGTSFSDFKTPAMFKSIIDGTDKISFVRNGLGNELPIYQQISAIHKAPALMRAAKSNLEGIRSGLRNGIATRLTVFEDNILSITEDGENPIGGIFVRSDYDSQGTNKNSAQMNFKEITYLSVMKSFYHNLHHNSGKIVLQSTCLSDKHTHFMVQYLTDKIRTYTGETLQNLLLNAASLNKEKRDNATQELLTEIKERYNRKTKIQVVNVLNRYLIALKSPLRANVTDDYNTLKSKIDEFHKLVSKYKLSDIQRFCQQANNYKGVDFKPEADLIELGEKVYLNETLYNNFITYCDPNNDRFKKRIETQIAEHARYLFQNKTILDANLDPDIERLMNSFRKQNPIEAKGWIDEYSNTMRVFRLFDKQTGKEIYPSYKQSGFNEQFDPTKVNVVLNPIFNSHFLADVLLSNSFNDIVFGEDYGVEGKFLKEANKTQKKLPALTKELSDLAIERKSLENNTDIKSRKRVIDIDKRVENIRKQIDESTWGSDAFFTRMEASRLGMHYKRTVHGGATYTPLLQNLKWGVGSKFKVAVVRDTKDPMFSLAGDIDEYTSQDGSGSASPYTSRMCNRSYVDGAVGKNKKTIFSYVDPETGVLTLIKWAEYEITNATRRDSPIDNYHASEELKFKKMHSMAITSKFNWDTFNIANYYNLNHGIPGVTRTKPIYKNVKTATSNKHYMLVKVENKGNDVKAYWQEVNDRGEAIGEVLPPEETIVRSIYDLDQLFGGCMVEDINEKGWLDWSEAQNDIVYTIICNEQNGILKDNFIHFSVNASSVKSGMTNVNDEKSYYGSYNRDENGNIINPFDDELMYFEISSRTGGAQMNADHILSEAEVTEMSQMISALIQAGLKTGTVKEVYEMLGQITADGLGNISKWVLDPGKEKEIYIWIGEALARSFTSGQGDTLGLAGAFIARANKNFQENGLKTKIPYSANTVKGVFESAITSYINNKSIRHKYPGGGFVQNPTFDVKPRFNIGGLSYSYTEFLDKIIEYNKQHKTLITAEQALTDKSIVRDAFGNPILTNGKIQFNNPFIEHLNEVSKTYLDIDDTILIWDENNTPKEIRLKTFDQLDYYRNLYKGNIAKWTCRPKNLLGSRTFFNVGDKRYSLYDLDSSRAALYCNYMLDDKPLEQDALSFLNEYVLEHNDELKFNIPEEYLEDGGVRYDFSNVDWFTVKQFAVAQIKQDLRQISKVKSGEIGVIKTQKAFNSVYDNTVISGITTSASQILIGVADAKAFDIQKTSDLEEIKKKGWKFFYDRSKHLITLPQISSIDRDVYDYAAHGADGSITLVCIGESREKAHEFRGFTVDSAYKTASDDHIYYNGEDLGFAGTKKFYKVVGNDGTEYKVIYCKSFEEFDEFNSNNNLYSNVVTNFNALNYINICNRRFGKILSLSNVKQIELEKQEKNLERLAKQKDASWKAYVKGIATRIPSQSMQSFTAVEVVGFTNDDVTNVYVSTMLAFLQGSDFDIDKDYIMRYGFTKDGKLATFSNLDKYFDPEKVLDLPMPSKKNFKIKFGTKEDVLAEHLFGEKDKIVYLNAQRGGLSLIKEVLKQPNGSVIIIHPGVLKAKEWREDLYTSDVNDQAHLEEYIKDNFEKWIKEHEKTKRTGAAKALAIRNVVVRKILDVITDPITQFNLQIPISMSEQRRAAEQSLMGSDEKSITSFNPSAKVMMQIQNMVGRDVIGIGASSLKAFFAASAYMNFQTDKIAKILKNSKDLTIEDSNEIFNLIKNVCFDSKFGTGLQTLANINYQDAIDALGDREFITISTEVFNKLYANKGLSAYCDQQGEITIVNLKKLLNDLNLAANGDWRSPIDAAYSLSGLISAATDNAKELILAKINATQKFADIYTYRLSIGDKFEDIAEFMMSPEFKPVADFAEGYMLDSGTRWFDLEHSVNFVLDDDTLPCISNTLFHGFLTNRSTGTNVITRLLYDLNDKPRPEIIKRYNSEVAGNMLRGQNVDAVLENVNVILNRNQGKSFDEVTDDYKKLLHFIYDLLRTDEICLTKTLAVVKTQIDLKKPSKIKKDDEPELLYEDAFDEEFYQDAYDEDVSTKAYSFNVEKLKYNDWKEIYRYITMYLVPKNQMLSGIEDLSNLKTLKDKILPGLKEQRILAKILSVNQGLDTKDFDEYKFIRDIESFVNEKLIKSKLPANEIEKFDLVKFLLDNETDENGKTYKDRMIDQYDKIKTTYNVLAVASEAEQFNAMLKMVGVNRKLIERAYILKVQRKLANQLLAINKKTVNGLSIGLTQKFNDKEYNILKNFVQSFITANWVGTLGDLQIAIPYDPENPKKYFEKGTDLEHDVDRPKEIPLNTADGMATFKWIMEHYVIDALKKHPEYRNNPFIKGLQLSSRIDADTGKEIEFYSFDIDLGHVDGNSAIEDAYNNYLSGFNKIYNNVLPRDLSTIFVDGKEVKLGITNDVTGDWTIGDLFYLYNLYVNKDGFGRDSLTRIFDTMVISDDETSLLYRYYEYICKLDSGMERIDDLEIDDGKFEQFANGGANFVTELRIALSKSPSAKSKFRSEFIPKDDKNPATYKLYNTSYGEQMPYHPSKHDVNYYLFPFITTYNPIVIKDASERLKRRRPQEFKLGGREAVEAIVSMMQRDFGHVIPIVTITDEWLDQNKIIDGVTRNAKGFVHDGKIYINVSPNKAGADTPIHELMHVFLASLKYSRLPERKKRYYDILRRISSDFNKAGTFWSKVYNDIASKYEGVAVGSDLQEEILAEGLGKLFSTSYFNAFEADSADDTVTAIYREFRNDIFNAIVDIFKLKLSNIPKNEASNPMLLDMTLAEVLVNFTSDLINHSGNELVQVWIPLNQKIAKYKVMLMNNALDDENDNKAKLTIEGDC